MKLTLAEVEAFIDEIIAGTVTLTPEFEQPQDIYVGNVPYIASNGWSIWIYNDCNEWDYIDSVTATDGRKFGFDDPPDSWFKLIRAKVKGHEWRCFGMPGYLQRRDEVWRESTV